MSISFTKIFREDRNVSERWKRGILGNVSEWWYWVTVTSEIRLFDYVRFRWSFMDNETIIEITKCIQGIVNYYPSTLHNPLGGNSTFIYSNIIIIIIVTITTIIIFFFKVVMLRRVKIGSNHQVHMWTYPVGGCSPRDMSTCTLDSPPRTSDCKCPKCCITAPLEVQEVWK